MSKVKFIQIGSESLQYNDITLESGDKIKGYKSKLDKALKDYPGAIIFGTYTENNEKKQEIWANGASYSVGGGGGGTVYVGTIMPDANGKINTPDARTDYQFYKDYWKKTDSGDNAQNDSIPTNFKEGDIYIYNPNGDNEPLKSTGFAHTKNRWEALAGRVNAENVWFPKGQKHTEKWGTADDVSVPTDICGKTDATIGSGYSLKDMLDYVLIQETFEKSTTSTSNTNAPQFIGELVTNPSLTILQYIELNSTATGTGTYTPTVKFSSGCVKSGQLIFGPSTIRNAIGYKGSLDQEGYTSGNKVGETTSVDVSVGTISNSTGSGHVIIKVSDKEVASTDYANGTAAKATWNIDTSAIGAYTAALTATNSTSCSATYKQNDKDVTFVNIPAIATIYPVTNKGNIPNGQNGVPDHVQKAGVSVNAVRVPAGNNSFPTSLSYTASPVTTKTYYVYLPIYHNGTKMFQKYYYGSNLLIFDDAELGMSMPDNCDSWSLEIPDTAKVTLFQSYDKANNKWVDVTTKRDIATTKTINGKDVGYTKYMFTDSAAFAAEAKIKISIR